MGNVWNPKRRRLLEAAIAVGVAGPVISCSASKSPWRYLTVEEAGTAAAICDRLIPADEFPGTVWGARSGTSTGNSAGICASTATRTGWGWRR